MDRLAARRTGQRQAAWRGLAVAVAVALSAAGCKPDSSLDGADEGLLPHLKLTGLVEEGPKRWALFLVAQPGRPTEHVKLLEGQRLGALEVRAIDVTEQAVSVRIGEVEATLSSATYGLGPEDGYAWLQRLTPDEHTRLHRTPDRQKLVDEHAQAQEERQRRELERELAERERAWQPDSSN